LLRDIEKSDVIHNDGIFIMAHSEIFGGRPFQDVVKKATITINIYNNDMILKELEPKQREANKNIQHIFPFIIAFMLLIGCNYGNSPKQQEVLHTLYFLLKFYCERFV
jgi:hypothetical protein